MSQKIKTKTATPKEFTTFCCFLPIFTTDISSQRICQQKFGKYVSCLKLYVKILSTNKPGQKALISIFFCSTFLTHANYHKQRGEHSHGNKLLRCLVYMHSVPAWWFLCLKDMSWNLKRNNNNRGGINIHIYIYKLYNIYIKWSVKSGCECRIKALPYRGKITLFQDYNDFKRFAHESVWMRALHAYLCKQVANLCECLRAYQILEIFWVFHQIICDYCRMKAQFMCLNMYFNNVFVCMWLDTKMMAKDGLFIAQFLSYFFFVFVKWLSVSNFRYRRRWRFGERCFWYVVYFGCRIDK